MSSLENTVPATKTVSMLAKFRERAASKESSNIEKNMAQSDVPRNNCSRMFKKYGVETSNSQGCTSTHDLNQPKKENKPIFQLNQIEEREKPILRSNQIEEEEKPEKQKFDEQIHEKSDQNYLCNNEEQFKALHFRTPLTIRLSEDSYNDYNFYGSKKKAPINWPIRKDGGKSSESHSNNMSNSDISSIKNEALTNGSSSVKDQNKVQNIKLQGSALLRLAKYIKNRKHIETGNDTKNCAAFSSDSKNKMSGNHQLEMSESSTKDFEPDINVQTKDNSNEKPDLISNSKILETEQKSEEKFFEKQDELIIKSETSSSFSSLDMDSQSEKTPEFSKKRGISDLAISTFKNCIKQESSKLLESPCTSDSEASKCFDVIIESSDKSKIASETSSISSFDMDSQKDDMDSKIKKFEKMSHSLLKNLKKSKDSENTENTIKKLEKISVALLQNLKTRKNDTNELPDSSTKFLLSNDQKNICECIQKKYKAIGTQCDPEDCMGSTKNDFAIKHYDPRDDEENYLTKHNDSEDDEKYVSEEIEKLVITEVTEDNDEGKNQNYVNKIDKIEINDLFKNQMAGLQFKKLSDSNEIIGDPVDPKVDEKISAGPSDEYPDINEDDFDVVIPENCEFYRSFVSKMKMSGFFFKK